MRILIGLALAPLVPGLLMLTLSLLGNPSEGIWALKLIVMFAYPAMIVLGLPIHLAFQRIGWTSVWPYIIAGALVGAVVAYFVFPTLNAGHVSASSIAIAAISAFFGAITATTFWLVVKPSNRSGVHQSLP